MTMLMLAERTVAGVGRLTLPGADGLAPHRGGALPLAPSAEPPPGSAAAHARHRWYLGHQAAFCVWVLLAGQLRAIASRPDAAGEAVPAAAGLLDAYSVLLLYSGSCGSEIYQNVLRPEMAAAHHAFSGTWARDYRPIPGLLRQLRATVPGRALAPHARANLEAHIAVGEHLVPGRESLLRAAGRRRGEGVSAAEHDLFDEFFLVWRAPVTTADLAAQLSTRLTDVAADIVAVTLPLIGTPAVQRLGRDAAEILVRSTVPVRPRTDSERSTRGGEQVSPASRAMRVCARW